MSDEGFHEIQLNGKQLVFLFMAATVVSVVIFLLGVMVGRGVPTARAQAAQAAEDTVIDPTADVRRSSGSGLVNSDRTPISAQESLTYAERLAAPTPAPEMVREPAVERIETAAPPVRETPPPPLPAEEPAPPASQPPAPVKEPAAVTTAATAPAESTFTEPAGNGHVVQVGAYPRANAETIARRLASKGYPVFITPRPQGLFAVRVGKYNDKREAEAIAARLETQEQFNKPWVTR